jgi:hypothetical protein
VDKTVSKKSAAAKSPVRKRNASRKSPSAKEISEKSQVNKDVPVKNIVQPIKMSARRSSANRNTFGAMKKRHQESFGKRVILENDLLLVFQNSHVRLGTKSRF